MMSTALCCSTAAAAAAATATATATTTTTTTTTTILTLISDSSSSSRRRTDRGAISDVKVADVTMMMLLRCTVCSRFSGFHLLLLIVKATFIIIIIISHRYDVRKHSFNEITWCCVVLAYTVSTHHGLSLSDTATSLSSSSSSSAGPRNDICYSGHVKYF